jgi:hypothetical protein
MKGKARPQTGISRHNKNRKTFALNDYQSTAIFNGTKKS